MSPVHLSGTRIVFFKAFFAFFPSFCPLSTTNVSVPVLCCDKNSAFVICAQGERQQIIVQSLETCDKILYEATDNQTASRVPSLGFYFHNVGEMSWLKLR